MAGLSLGLGLGLQPIFGAAGGGGSPLAITGTPVTTGTDGTAYAGFTATASGGTAPYTYSLVGTWPTGISINSSTGAVSGTPTQSGSFTGLSVRVTDAAAATADLDAFSLTVAAAGDPHIANVVFLAGFEGVDGATAYTEESSLGAAATFVSACSLSTTLKLFGSSSLKSVGGSDSLTFPDNDNYTFGMSPFTIDISAYHTATSNLIVYAQHSGGTSATRGFTLQLNSNVMTWIWRNTIDNTETITQTGTWTPSTGQWYKIRVDKDDSNVLRMYVDGVMIGKGTVTGNKNVAAPLAFPFRHGYLDEIRITNGVARCGSDSGYTPDAAAFPRS